MRNRDLCSWGELGGTGLGAVGGWWRTGEAGPSQHERVGSSGRNLVSHITLTHVSSVHHKSRRCRRFSGMRSGAEGPVPVHLPYQPLKNALVSKNSPPFRRLFRITTDKVNKVTSCHGLHCVKLSIILSGAHHEWDHDDDGDQPGGCLADLFDMLSYRINSNRPESLASWSSRCSHPPFSLFQLSVEPHFTSPDNDNLPRCQVIHGHVADLL